LVVRFGIQLYRVGVQVTGEQLIIRNYLRTHMVNAHEIRAITLQPREMGAAGPRWIAQVELINGKHVWMSSFDCGPANQPWSLELAAHIDEVQSLLGVGTRGVREPGRRQAEGVDSE
jgi:hypothetical protein